MKRRRPIRSFSSRTIGTRRGFAIDRFVTLHSSTGAINCTELARRSAEQEHLPRGGTGGLTPAITDGLSATTTLAWSQAPER